jgi:hypothetical protein
MSELRRIDETLWEIPADSREDMRVPARLFADPELLTAIEGDRSLEQLANMATLPGIVDFALAMPDIHQAYGFPVGGVAATETPDGVSRWAASATTSTAVSGCWRRRSTRASWAAAGKRSCARSRARCRREPDEEADS